MRGSFFCIAKCQLQVNCIVVSGQFIWDCDIYLPLWQSLYKTIPSTKQQWQSTWQPNWRWRKQGHFCCVAKCQLQVDWFEVSGHDCDVNLSFPDNLLVKQNNISLWENQIGDEGAKFISIALQNVNCKLTDLGWVNNSSYILSFSDNLLLGKTIPSTKQ